jgi:hypothetical protein
MRNGDRNGAPNQTSHKFVDDHGHPARQCCASCLSPTPMSRPDLDQNGACDLAFPQIDKLQRNHAVLDLAGD